MRWGFIVSIAILAPLLLVAFLRRPWMSAHVTPLTPKDGRIELTFAMRNHGYQDFGRAIVNVLVPDDAGLAERKRTGEEYHDRILHTPESVDGQRESDYWGEKPDLVRGTILVGLAVDDDRDVLPMKIRIGNPRKPLRVALREVGKSHDVEFARAQPVVFRLLARLPIAGKHVNET